MDESELDGFWSRDEFSTLPSSSSGSTAQLGATASVSEEDLKTVSLANEIKLCQGNAECEVTFGGESDLLKQKIQCVKNPGHKDFIPVPEFKLEHLPLLYRNEDVLQDILLHAKLTFRIRGKLIGNTRPEKYPGTDKAYPFSEQRGKNIPRTGTGWIDRVDLNDVPRCCQCKSCAKSQVPRATWGKVRMSTASHVLFGKSEVEDAVMELFYDDEKARSEKRIKTLHGVAGGYPSIDRDVLRFYATTHDTDLLLELNDMVNQCKQHHTKVYSNFASDAHGLVVVISHPHGRSKQITIGEKVERQMHRRGRVTCYTYNTPTCNGSSGAPVIIFGRGLGWPSVTHPHSSGLASGVNISAYGFDNYRPIMGK